MSMNPKCPLCQKGTVMIKDNHRCECSRCRFQCHRGHLDRVAAAMDLARVRAEYDRIDNSCDDDDAVMDLWEKIKTANARVLESFR